MEKFISIMILFGLMIVPFLVGRHAESGRKGFGLLSLVPLAILVIGIVEWLRFRSSSNAETADWAVVSLVVAVLVAGALEFLALIGFGAGRWRRHVLLDRSRNPEPTLAVVPVDVEVQKPSTPEVTAPGPPSRQKVEVQW